MTDDTASHENKYVEHNSHRVDATGLVADPASSPLDPEKSDPVQIEGPKNLKSPWPFRIRLFLALLLPVFLETLDYTIVATAQPHIASAFHRLDLQGWIGTAYLLTSTVFLPLYGSFTDIFGRHWAMQSALVWFIIGSALSTGAQNMPMMLAGRGIAGIGAAGFLSVVRIILADSRSLDENTFQSTMMTLLYTIGYSTGPVIGGALTSVSFRWVFGINLPASVLAMILVFFLLRGRVKGSQPSSRQRARAKIIHKRSHRHYTYIDKLLTVDFIGATLFIAGGILLLLGLNWGSTAIWNSARVIVSLVLGGLLIVASLVWENIIEHYDDPEREKELPRVLEAEPMLPIPVFRNWDTIICQYVVFTSGMVMLVAFYFVAIFFTIVGGQDPTRAGVQLIYFAPGVGAGVTISVQLIRHLRQPKYPIILGTIIIPVALGLISTAIIHNHQAQVNGFMALAGVGTGLTFAPTGIHARFSQPANRVAVVESLQLFFRTLGGTVGLAQCSTVLNSKVKSGIADLIRSGILSPSDFNSNSGSLLSSIDQINALPGPAADGVREAFRNGTRWAFISLIPWTGLAVFMVVFLSKIEDTDKKPETGVTNGAATANQSNNTNSDLEKQRSGGGVVDNGRVDGAASRPITVGNTTVEEPGPKPNMKKVIGPIGLIVFLVKRANWNAKVKKYEKAMQSQSQAPNN